MNTQRTPTDQVRADLAQRVSRNPLLQPFQFTPEQEQARAKQEAAMRADQLRRLPTVFGGL